MDNTINKEQFKKITNTLVTSGSFAISNLEKGNNISREQIGRILKTLIQEKILTTNKKRGAGVKYKLSKTENGLYFLLHNIAQASIEDIAKAWDVSIASAKKYIKQFVDSGFLEKIGRPPKKISYILTKNKTIYDLGEKEEQIIERYFSVITPAGRLLEGIRGFEYFIQQNVGEEYINQHIINTAKKYLITRQEYYNYSGEKQLINITDNFKKTFQDKSAIKKAFCSDFDKLPLFGETKLYQLIKIAKAGQSNLDLMLEIISQINNDIQQIISTYNIEAVAFIPPTIMRKTQLITFWRERLNINLPQIILTKNPALLPVQQKNLSTLKEKSIHAKESIQLKQLSQNTQYQNVLIIDDISDSGATLNETAKLLLKKEIAQEIYAFTAIGANKH